MKSLDADSLCLTTAVSTLHVCLSQSARGLEVGLDGVSFCSKKTPIRKHFAYVGARKTIKSDLSLSI